MCFDAGRIVFQEVSGLTDLLMRATDVSAVDRAAQGVGYRDQCRPQGDGQRIEDGRLTGGVRADQQSEPFVESKRSLVETPEIREVEPVDAHREFSGFVESRFLTLP